MNLSPFELAGPPTHLAVFVVGLGGSILPLARGRRSGLALQPVFQPRWLLIGPASPKNAGADGE